MTGQKSHPDFDAAPEERRYAGELAQLTDVLKHEAYELKGEWAWRILPRGALVAMRVPPTFRKELRIARQLRKGLTDQTAKAWHTELRVFLEHLGCTDWKCTKDVIEPGDPPKLEAIYEEVAPLGAAKAALVCARCKNEFEPHPDDKLYREPICTSCAVKAGQQEVADNRAARGAP